jgi:hypothetical protein
MVTRLNKSALSNLARPGSELPGPPRTTVLADRPGSGGGEGFTDAASKAGSGSAVWPYAAPRHAKAVSVTDRIIFNMLLEN